MSDLRRDFATFLGPHHQSATEVFQICTRAAAPAAAAQRLFLPEVPELQTALSVVLFGYQMLMILGSAPDVNMTAIWEVYNNGTAGGNSTTNSTTGGNSTFFRSDFSQGQIAQTILKNPQHVGAMQNAFYQALVDVAPHYLGQQPTSSFAQYIPSAASGYQYRSAVNYPTPSVGVGASYSPYIAPQHIGTQYAGEVQATGGASFTGTPQSYIGASGVGIPQQLYSRRS